MPAWTISQEHPSKDLLVINLQLVWSKQEAVQASPADRAILRGISADAFLEQGTYEGLEAWVRDLFDLTLTRAREDVTSEGRIIRPDEGTVEIVEIRPDQVEE